MYARENVALFLETRERVSSSACITRAFRSDSVFVPFNEASIRSCLIERGVTHDRQAVLFARNENENIC